MIYYGEYFVKIEGRVFTDRYQYENSYEFPEAGDELKRLEPSGGEWRVLVAHNNYSGGIHDITGYVEQDGKDGTRAGCTNMATGLIHPGVSRTIYVGEHQTQVTFVHAPGNHSRLPNLFGR